MWSVCVCLVLLWRSFMVQEFAIGILAIAADIERAEDRVRVRLPAETRKFWTIGSWNTNRGYTECILTAMCTHALLNLTVPIIPTCISWLSMITPNEEQYAKLNLFKQFHPLATLKMIYPKTNNKFNMKNAIPNNRVHANNKGRIVDSTTEIAYTSRVQR